MATRIHPKNVHESHAKKSTKCHLKRGLLVDKSVHEKSPLLSTRSHLLCPRDVCHPISFSDLPYATLKKFRLNFYPICFRVAKAPIFSKLKLRCRLKGECIYTSLTKWGKLKSIICKKKSDWPINIFSIDLTFRQCDSYNKVNILLLHIPNYFFVRYKYVLIWSPRGQVNYIYVPNITPI